MWGPTPTLPKRSRLSSTLSKTSPGRGTTWQVVETACFIELRDLKGRLLNAYSFLEAKEEAFLRGLLTWDGKLIGQVSEP
ncbi:hypothetical protein COV28_01215 [candidate division WWE3 bacterium CG10_big_fil_rev_8_21_14_0_10_48_23]|uniref:Uncharacterized protein n=1 Tax=candidate division WWE3 bacterium CG_4_9_14_0_2_um_filter_48_10 TaxID=1975078 RepID=A0A2M8EHR6_UNCKA|nr:MAG: hypothetical protein CO059_03155 [candidate division WWE3 bacterium CG_4_9_14_0_2_um_filter_48_10]PJE52001.1 MAG: hypothetical protein COV28_01215 [candidate division WWE3 bacterium CG10_big_fil_rev_8_21_14_0_10_48_23]